MVDSADRGATERECYEVKCSVFAQEFVVDAYDKKKQKKTYDESTNYCSWLRLGVQAMGQHSLPSKQPVKPAI